MIATCHHCGIEFDCTVTSNKWGQQKHIFCSAPECQKACSDIRKEEQRIASQKYRDRQKNGTVKKYKPRKSKKTGRFCQECGKPIKKYKENGAWIEPYWSCASCTRERHKYRNQLQSAGQGEAIERIDGDFIFMGV